MSIREIAQNFHNFCPKYILPLFEFLIAFAQNFPLLLPKFREKQWEIRAKAMKNSGKSNGKIWAKAMRKLGKRGHIFRAKIIAFPRISHCFCPNFLLLFPAFPIAFARISHCFCPNFSFSNFFGGGTVPPCPPPPPPASYAYDHQPSDYESRVRTTTPRYSHIIHIYVVVVFFFFCYCCCSRRYGVYWMLRREWGVDIFSRIQRIFHSKLSWVLRRAVQERWILLRRPPVHEWMPLWWRGGQY